ncbi:ribonuclease H-like domain-containing protein [Tanacetum coccineum]
MSSGMARLIRTGRKHTTQTSWITPTVFSTMTVEDPTWNMDTGDSILPTLNRPLHLHNVLVTPNIIKNHIYVRQFTRDNNCTVEFDAFGFSVKDFLTRHILLRCDSSGDLYPVTSPSSTPHALLCVSPSTWHQRLGHPGEDVLRSLKSRQYISYNKEKSSHLCHACQLGKHVRLPFTSSNSIITCSFEIVHYDIWTSPIASSGYANRVGFSSSRCDSSLFIYQHGFEVAYLLIYVDDIVLTASSTDLLQRIISSLHKEFDMTDLGALNYFLGISVTCDSIGMLMSQKKYALDLLEKAHMANCNPTRTPVDTESKLGSDGDPISDPTLYRSLAAYLASLKKYSDIFVHIGLRLQHYATVVGSLISYSEVDWAVCPTTRALNNRGVANVVAKTAWLRNLLRELHAPLLSATLVYCDNVSVIYMTANLVQHHRTKHIEIDITLFRIRSAMDGRAGCRKIIALDGCFLKSPNQGEILTTIGRDGNNHIYPVAWAVVNVENKDNWTWFLELLERRLI